MFFPFDTSVQSFFGPLNFLSQSKALNKVGITAKRGLEFLLEDKIPDSGLVKWQKIRFNHGN